MWCCKWSISNIFADTIRFQDCCHYVSKPSFECLSVQIEIGSDNCLLEIDCWLLTWISKYKESVKENSQELKNLGRPEHMEWFRRRRVFFSLSRLKWRKRHHYEIPLTRIHFSVFEKEESGRCEGWIINKKYVRHTTRSSLIDMRMRPRTRQLIPL